MCVPAPPGVFFPVCPVCVLAPPGVFLPHAGQASTGVSRVCPGSPRCLFTGYRYSTVPSHVTLFPVEAMQIGLRALRRHCSSYRPPTRSILSQRIEQAAREGDLTKVRAILAEADETGFVAPPQGQLRRLLTTSFVTYAIWNSTAAAYDYYRTSKVATELLLTHSEVKVKLRLQSFSWRGTLCTTVEDETSEKKVFVLPHAYITDILTGQRSRWSLNVHKLPNKTRWFTTDVDPEDGEQ